MGYLRQNQISNRYSRPFLATPCNCFVDVSKIPAERSQKPTKRLKTPKRIKLLARPKQPTSKFQPLPVERFKKTIEIIRDPDTSTRIRQLAIPRVRTIVATREEFKSKLNPYFIARFDRLVLKSLYTVYSRLANVDLPRLKEKPDKWTEDQWKIHQEWLNRRAKPKYKTLKFINQRPDLFTSPITRIHRSTMDPKVANRPWLKKYAFYLSDLTLAAQEREKAPLFGEPLTKVSRNAVESTYTPKQPYFQKLFEDLKQQSEANKEWRKRMEELKAKEIILKPPKKAAEFVDKIPEKFKTLSEKPKWIAVSENTEKAFWKEEEEKRTRVRDRKKIKQKPSKRTRALALMTESKQDMVKEKLEKRKKEAEEMVNAFKSKPVKQLPKKSKIPKLAEPLERRKREKFVRPVDEKDMVVLMKQKG